MLWNKLKMLVMLSLTTMLLSGCEGSGSVTNTYCLLAFGIPYESTDSNVDYVERHNVIFDRTCDD